MKRVVMGRHASCCRDNLLLPLLPHTQHVAEDCDGMQKLVARVQAYRRRTGHPCLFGVRADLAH